MTNSNMDAIKRAIDICGDMTKFSLKLNISYQTALNWKHGRRRPSALHCIKIEKLTEGKVKREEILPNYPWEEAKIDENKELEIAKNMLEMGMTKEDISKATGLSLEEIEKLI